MGVGQQVGVDGEENTVLEEGEGIGLGAYE